MKTNWLTRTVAAVVGLSIYFGITVSGFAAPVKILSVSAAPVKLVSAELKDEHHYDVLSGTVSSSSNPKNATVGIRYKVNGSNKTSVVVATFDAIRKDGTAIYKFEINLTDKSLVDSNGLTIRAVSLDNKGNVINSTSLDQSYVIGGSKSNFLLAKANVGLTKKEFSWNDNNASGAVVVKKSLNIKSVDVYYQTNDNPVWKKVSTSLERVVGTTDEWGFEVPVSATTTSINFMIGTKTDGISKIDHSNQDIWNWTR